MKKNSFSRQLCVSLKMINDVMILPCIRELENSLHLGALVTSPRCCSCSPKHEGRRALAWRGLLGGQGGSPIPLGGWGRAGTCPLCRHRAVCVAGLQPGPLPALLGWFLCPHSQAQPLLPAVSGRCCPFTLGVPRCHSRAGGRNPWVTSHAEGGVWGEGEKFPLSRRSMGCLAPDPEPVRSSAGHGAAGAAPAVGRVWLCPAAETRLDVV